MKNFLVTCLLSLAFFCSAFAATASFYNEEADCKKVCPAKSAQGCPLRSCFWATSGNTVEAVCSYELDCGPAPSETPRKPGDELEF